VERCLACEADAVGDDGALLPFARPRGPKRRPQRWLDSFQLPRTHVASSGGEKAAPHGSPTESASQARQRSTMWRHLRWHSYAALSPKNLQTKLRLMRLSDGTLLPIAGYPENDMAGRICSCILVPIMFLLFGCASTGSGPKSSSSQKFQSPTKVTQTNGAEGHPAPIAPAAGDTGFHGLSLANFYQRIVGGQVIEATNDQIVVEAKSPKSNSDPVALTNDAIIATSVRARIARNPRLKNNDFQISSNDGIVSIRAQQDSLDDAVSVINLALAVPDVREVVYVLPTRV